MVCRMGGDVFWRCVFERRDAVRHVSATWRQRKPSACGYELRLELVPRENMGDI